MDSEGRTDSQTNRNGVGEMESQNKQARACVCTQTHTADRAKAAKNPFPPTMGPGGRKLQVVTRGLTSPAAHSVVPDPDPGSWEPRRVPGPAQTHSIKMRMSQEPVETRHTEHRGAVLASPRQGV